MLVCCGCFSPRLRLPVWGRVVDAETGTPVAGASVILDTTAYCARLPEGYSRDLPTEWTTTNHKGRFRIGRLLTVVRCVPAGWGDDLIVVAAGYRGQYLHRGAGLDDEFRDIGLHPLRLHRLRYLLELQSLGRDLALVGEIGNHRSDPAVHDVARRALAAPVVPLDARGVFARDPAARFDRVVTTRLEPSWFPQDGALVIAEEGRTGILKAWTGIGTPVALPFLAEGGWSIVGASRPLHGDVDVPYLARNDELYYAADVHGWSLGIEPQSWARTRAIVGGIRAAVRLEAGLLLTLEGNGDEIGLYRHAMGYREDRLWNVIEPIGHIAASALFPGHVECMTHAAGTGIFVVDGPDGLSVYGLWVSTRAMSAEELLGELRSARPRRLSIPGAALAGEVTGCAANAGAASWGSNLSGTLYVAIRGAGIHELALNKQRVDATRFWRNAAVAALPTTFTGMAVGGGLGALFRGCGPVLYAVSGDGVVYRFLNDGTPDQRIEIESRG